MAEIKLRFDLTFSRRFVAAAGAVSIMLCAVPELESESVTLSTYYPAPSGVYTKMITTGDTLLARDGGQIAMGTPVAGAALLDGKLHVVGDIRLDRVRFGTSEAFGVGLAGDYYSIWREVGGWVWPYPDLVIQYHTGIKHDAYYGYGGHRFYTGYDGTGNPTGAGSTTGNGPMLTVDDAVRVRGPIQSQQGVDCTGPFTYIYITPAGGVVSPLPNCVGGYVTLTDGIYAKYTIIPVVPTANTNPQITYRCCPCPVSGCAGM